MKCAHSQRIMRTAVGLALLGSSIGIAGCAAYSDLSEGDVDVVREEILSQCGPTDGRSAVTNLTYPMGAIGKITRPAQGYCSASIIAPNKILTAQHCITASATDMTFHPQWGILNPGAGPTSLNSTRIVAGRDDTSGAPGDWAIVTLNGNLQTLLGANYQQVSREGSTPPQWGEINHVGYHQDFYSNRPGKQACTYNTGPGFASHVNLVCDIDAGASGGPAYQLLGANNAVVVALYAGQGSPDCDPPASGISRAWFAYAPDNPGGVAASTRQDGRTEFFATDKDWPQVLTKVQVSAAAGSSWEPWQRNATFANARKITVVTLQDYRRQAVVLTSSNTARTRWETTPGGSWSAWADVTLPTQVKDVASSGGVGLPSHLYFLGTNNRVYRMYKTGDANSAWAGPIDMGLVTGATTITATYGQGAHRVLVADSSGAVSSDGASANFSAFQRRGQTLLNGLVSITVGTLADGRLHILGATPTGGIRSLLRSTAGAWTNWSNIPIPVPPRAGGFHSLATAKLTGSNALQILAASNDGNLYTIWETGGGAFTTAWARAYM